MWCTYKVFAKKCLTKSIPNTINSVPNKIRHKRKTHSMQTFVNDIKALYLANYEVTCSIVNCYICNNA